jgi:hypothetical protein
MSTVIVPVVPCALTLARKSRNGPKSETYPEPGATVEMDAICPHVVPLFKRASTTIVLPVAVSVQKTLALSIKTGGATGDPVGVVVVVAVRLRIAVSIVILSSSRG